MRTQIWGTVLLLPWLLAGADAPVAQRFAGHWKLISYDLTTPSGEVAHPFGKDPIGRISYDATGHMSAQLMRRGRGRFASNDPRKGTDPEIRDAATGYSAYFGSYTVEESAGTVTHHVEGAWFPNWIGSKQVRHYEFHGNRMTLRADLPSGRAVLVWERIP